MNHSRFTHRRPAWLSLLLGLALVLSSLLPAAPTLAQAGPVATAAPAKAAAPTTVSATPEAMAGLGGPPFIYFVPLPEDQIKATYDTIQTNGSTYRAATFVTAGVNGTVITYDQWEDGYEANIANPGQASTRIYGDGNPANGDANAYCSASCAGDIINAGDVLVLEANQTLTIPRNPSQIKFDGKDKFATNYPVAGGRAYWPTDAGPLMAEAGQFYSTDDYGTNFVMPIGEDLSSYSYEAFERVAAFIMAANNQTKCTYRGSPLNPINEGQSVRVPNVQTGDALACDKPVQVHLITGDTGSNYEVRAFEAFARNTWTNSYYDPVGTVNTKYPSVNYVYNPHTTPLTVRAETRFGTTSFSVPANGVTRYLKPDSAVHLFSSDGRDFYALNVNDADTAQPGNSKQNQTYDWGHPLIPESLLTTMMVSGWSPGSEDGTPPNAGPVWVTALADTTLYIDYDADPTTPTTGCCTDSNGNKYDATLALTRLQSARIYDTADNDQTGLRLYTLDGVKISGAWGEDGSRANVARPNIDAGTVALPFPVPSLNKSVTLAVDGDGDGQYDTGDTARYRIAVRNAGGQPLTNVRVEDTLPAGVAYVAGSTTLDGAAVADDAGAFPLLAANGGLALPDPTQAPGTTPAGAQYAIEFLVTIQPAAAGKVLTNTALLFSSAQNLQSSVDITVPPSTITACTLDFTDSGGAVVSFVLENGQLYVTVADADHNLNGAVQETVGVVVRNVTGGDVESLVLTETTISSGIFRNTAGLPVSTTAGAAAQDGTLNARVGQTLQADYTDALFGDTCNDTLLMAGPTQTKVLYLSDPGQSLDRVDPVATGDATTATSPVFASSAVTLNAVSTGTVANATSLTIAHTTSSGANRLMLVGVSINRLDGTTNEYVTGITYGIQALTLVGAKTSGGTTEARVEIWALKNPPSGTANVVVTFDKSLVEGAVVGVATFTGVDQTTPYGAFFSNSGNGTSQTLSVTSAAGELVFDTVMLRSADFGASGSPGTGQTQRWKIYFNSRVGAGGSTKSGAASVTMSWTSASAVDWSLGAVSIKPTAAVSTTTFTQTPTMAGNFVMPAGGLITVTNYVSTTGTLPANPAITATLKANGTTFATLTNPTATLVSGGTPSFYRLAWSAALASTTTVATGQAVSLTVTSGITQTFQILYDSSTYPSRVQLPTNTVIKVDSLAIYNAPYPGGSLVTTTSPGQTLYVRAQVSDPFGAYDVTGATLNISSTLVALTAGNVVTSTTASKTYEYAWFVPAGSCLDTYPVSITATEGSEGITAAAQTEILSICDDFGTQCAAHFLTALGGSITTRYNVGDSVFMRVVDFDQNLNAGAAETLNVTVSSTTYTLTETGVNTGVFEGSDGAIAAGQVAQLIYVDPNTLLPGADVCTAEALTPQVGGASTPGVFLLKWLTEPAVGPAIVGDVVRFQLEVFNTGDVILDPVVITDTFDNTRLQFTSASPAPTGSAAGSLSWNNLGPLTGGESKVIEVVFRAVGTAAPTVNNATVTATPPSGPVLTETASANVTIVGPALALSKTTLTPADRQAKVGQDVTFSIVITNTGSSVMDVLPLVDNFDAFCLAYVSASPSPTATGYGVLFWQDLTQTFGQNLGLGQQFTLSVTLRSMEVCDPAVNHAAVEVASDVNGNPPPPVSDDDFVQTSASYDFGDLPDTTGGTGTGDYQTLLANDGARHALSLFRPLLMGAVTPDAETDGQPNATATGDDIAGVPDEDGVTLPTFIAGQPATVVVTVTNATGVSATLYGFIDFNGDGIFGPGETVTVTVPHNTDGPLALPFTVPGNASPSQPVGARFRLSTAGNLTALGLAPDGEIEDYVVPIIAAARIGDTVYTDVNGNGTQDGGEPGLGDVVVRLALPAGSVVTTTTTITGFYEFTILPPGAYTVTVDSATIPAGYVLTTGNVPLAVSLGGGQNYDTADFGYQPLPVTIGDRTCADTNLNLICDAADFSINGVQLHVTGVDVLGAAVDITVTTSSTGYYLINTLVPGTYTVTAPTAYFGFSLVSAATLTTTLSGGSQDLGLDFIYAMPTATDVMGLAAASEPASSGVRLRWTLRPGATSEGFLIYRAERREGPYKRITPELLPATPGVLEYDYLDQLGVFIGQVNWYQLQTLPSGGMIGPIASTPTYSNRTFLPAVSR